MDTISKPPGRGERLADSDKSKSEPRGLDRGWTDEDRRGRITTGTGVPVVAGAVRLATVTMGRTDDLFDVRFVIIGRNGGYARTFDGAFRPETLIDFDRFRRVALRNHRVLARHAAAEARGAAGDQAWADEVERAMDAGAEGRIGAQS
ncbi:hypothetical protein [Saccharicrinis sp. FJH54]|uniref:hypothetical protein n=1 Tax=Saccharicrinis sp. FJH54 TaxID=3344665 RepID=UPI0035D4F094